MVTFKFFEIFLAILYSLYNIAINTQSSSITLEQILPEIKEEIPLEDEDSSDTWNAVLANRTFEANRIFEENILEKDLLELEKDLLEKAYASNKNYTEARV